MQSLGDTGKIIVDGKHTYGIENITIRSWGENAVLRIGSFCSIADKIEIFLGGNHRTDWITTFPFGHAAKGHFKGGDLLGHPISNGDVTIQNDVWIGSGATIMSGITLANGSVVAAKSVVTRNVPAYSIVGGSPAKIIKYRFSDEIIRALLDLQWWKYPDAKIQKVIPILQKSPTPEALKNIAELLVADIPSPVVFF